MPSLSRTSISLTTAVALAVLTAACGSGEPTDPLLERLVCLEQDLPDGFAWQTDGSLDPGDLASIAGGDVAVLDAAGVEGGYLAYWKELLDRPPSEPPIEIVCQALAFTSPDEASSFVANLEPRSGERLAVAGLGFLLERGFAAAELPPDAAAGLPEGTRSFAVEAHGTNYAVYSVLMPFGAFVLSVHIGDQGGRAAPTEAHELAERVAKRALAGPFQNR